MKKLYGGLLVLTFIMYLFWKQYRTSELIHVLSDHGKLELGKVISINETLKSHIISYEIEYFVKGQKYIRETNRGDRNLNIGDYVWILYNSLVPEQAFEYYFLAERKSTIAEVIDMVKVNKEMEVYLDSVFSKDGVTEIGYDSIGVVLEPPSGSRLN